MAQPKYRLKSEPPARKGILDYDRDGLPFIDTDTEWKSGKNQKPCASFKRNTPVKTRKRN